MAAAARLYRERSHLRNAITTINAQPTHFPALRSRDIFTDLHFPRPRIFRIEISRSIIASKDIRRRHASRY